MPTIIHTTIKVPGFHCWPKAPAEVAFLRNQHRHLFTIKVAVEVTHGDREVEFFMLQREVKSALGYLYPKDEHGFDFENSSCENIACELTNYLTRVVGYTIGFIQVFEDDESGATYVPDNQS